MVPKIPEPDIKGRAVISREMGMKLLHDPIHNKSTAFPESERDRLGLRGLIPSRVVNLEVQVQRVLQKLRREPDDIHRYDFLSQLQDRNETLFYRVLMDNIEEFAPIIYTPTVGQACLQFGSLYRRARGMYFSSRDKGEMRSMVYNWPEDEVDVIVVTDGSRILGLGDLGTNGMSIPIGKLALYCAGAGIHPRRTLPVMIDVGTDNAKLRNDPLYLGLQQPRLKGDEFFRLIGEFLDAVRERWPNALVQFEDFSSDTAHPMLHKYRHKYLCFNDDIQGTGAVTLAGVLAALRAQGKPASAICEQRIVCVGSGSAGLGVSFALSHAMQREGMSPQEAANNFYMVDRDGLLTTLRPGLSYGQQQFARADIGKPLPLLDVVKHVRPTVLMGLSGAGRVFTEEIVREVAKNCQRPIVFPLSNPTAHAECTAEQAFEWTDGRCLFASGSPFGPVEYKGQVYHVNQCNNMFIFPGVGLGAVACRPSKITPEMFVEGANALASFLTDSDLRQGRIYPRIRDIRAVSKRIAMAVVQHALKTGLAHRGPRADQTLEDFVQEHMWEPQYQPIVYDPHKRH